MPLALLTVPCLTDNYAFVIGNPDTKEAALVDVPDSDPINQYVDNAGWKLTAVLLTHHHDDHIQGLDGLKNRPDLQVIGASADAHRLPPLDKAVGDGDSFDVLGETVDVFDVSGHTNGHIAFHFAKSQFLFSADSLMAMGCGRLFEGTPVQMWQSLLKLRALPRSTTVCSGHEYTASNAKFALSLEEANPALSLRVKNIEKARRAGQPTVPSNLGLEIDTNPFLRADVPSLMAAVGMQDAEPVDVFAEIRGRKDRF